MRWLDDRNSMRAIRFETEKEIACIYKVSFDKFKPEHCPFPLEDFIHYNFPKDVVFPNKDINTSPEEFKEKQFSSIRTFMQKFATNNKGTYYVAFVGIAA